MSLRWFAPFLVVRCVLLVPGVLLVSSTAHAKDNERLIAPPEAIALADAKRRAQDGQAGRFELTILAAGRVGDSVFLNSSTDYRAPDNLSLRLLPNAVAAFTRRYGQPPESYFIGKHVVIDGTVRREPIVNVDQYFHRVKSFNRWQHVVRIILAGQLISVDGTSLRPEQ